MTDSDVVAGRLDEQLREADGRLDALRKDAEARKAQAELMELSGLRAARDGARKKVADLRAQPADAEAAQRSAEAAVHELERGIERVNDRYSTWDDAHEQRFTRVLQEAEGKLKIWRARADGKETRARMWAHDALNRLEEQAAVVRSCLAEWERARDDARKQQQLQEAAKQFDEAYDAAAKRYEK